MLFVASLAVGLAFLDETAVVTALRAIQADLGLSSLELQWVMGAYLLALASLMAAAGRVADVNGRRRTFLVGAVIFAVGSAVCALAPTAGVLIAGRGVQGSARHYWCPGLCQRHTRGARGTPGVGAGHRLHRGDGSLPSGRSWVGCSHRRSGGAQSSRSTCCRSSS